MTKQKLKIQKAPKVYKIDPEKLSELPQRVFALVMCDTMYFSEDYKYFDVIKPYLDIPEEPKTLEQISQELNDKIDELIENTKNKFYQSKYISEKLYNTKFNRIIQDFEYAKEHGQFPQKLTLGYSKFDSSNFVVSGSSVESSLVIKQGKKHEGYYTNGNRRYFKYYMPDKPNMIVRFFMKTCLGFYWVDEKDT
ncbi:hypothetical protein PQC13_gp085 [Synechococcus phage S-SRM01]|uniref:Uncharacterized protein n=1 Tax=Synechococcus phage S-SRM01 TaxID=2781608 RepID=A0A879R3V2_9CAUD|nr:hypothetical protein PQC13_gp085 [Synechococcus phage S-SRM01]QPX48050.1 hypothetical protein [Synechococcus phage S-SRM01]